MTSNSEPPTEALQEEGTVTVKDGTLVIVRDNDTVGAAFLGLLALALLFALARANARNRNLLRELATRPAEGQT